MSHEFKLPDVGEGITEAEVLKWMVREGDGVREDDPIAEVETDKAIIEIPSPVDGVVQRKHAEIGDEVGVGETLVTFDTNGGGEEARNDGGVEILDSDGNAAVSVDAGGGEEETEIEGDGGSFASESTRRLAREVGVDIEELEGSGSDGRVVAQDVLHAAKESQDEEESASGSSVVEPEEKEEDPRGENTAEEEKRTVSAGHPASDDEKTPTMEEEDEVAPEFDEGMSPAVEPEKAEETSMFGDEETPVAERVGEAEETEEDRVGEDEEKDETESPNSTTVTHHDTADAEMLVEVRERMSDSVSARLTYTAFLVKACAVALNEHRLLNGRLDEPRASLDEINVGYVTEAEDGVVVPVVRNADEKGLAEIAAEVEEGVEEALSGDFVSEDEGDRTFTLANLGVIGGEGTTGLVGGGETAAVTVGEIRRRPRVVDDEVVPRYTVPLSVSFDESVVDIATAAKFTEDLKSYLSEPAEMLL